MKTISKLLPLYASRIILEVVLTHALVKFLHMVLVLFMEIKEGYPIGVEKIILDMDAA